MKLNDLQFDFALNAARLIERIFERGYTCTLGEAWRTQEMADLYAEQGKGIKNSLHIKRLAIDLNLFKDGVYLPDTESHRQFGEWWEDMDPRLRWGGRFKDGNHYEMKEVV